jgi:hypothetical protein
MSDDMPSMIFRKKNKEIQPIKVFPVNGIMVLAIYKGTLSPFDILLKYRQKNANNKWSRIRTPKHIHWAVDVLLKMQQYKSLTKEFLDFMIDAWKRTKPIESEKKRQSLNLDELLQVSTDELKKFEQLSKAGEYSIRFLILLAKLLMLQEKTNRHDAYMFRKLLESLKQNNDLFQIISSASFGGR